MSAVLPRALARRQATRAGADLTLSVLRANPAKALYERLGFVTERESGFSYEMRRKPLTT